MLLSNFDFNLPPKLIAQFPLQKRSDSRLLCLNKTTGEISHYKFKDLPKLLEPKDLIIFNNTKVIPARLHANKPSGGKVEIFIERILTDHRFLAQTKSRKPLKTGEKLILNSDICFKITGRQNNLFELSVVSSESIHSILEKLGNVPLPPYIKRQPNLCDQTTYQTIYAKHPGAVAAPTAGLHFDQNLISELKNKNILSDFVTLHVGLGTFQPVRAENIEEHKMHKEYISVSKNLCDKIKKSSKKIVAVGTTSVRSLESAAKTGEINEYQGDTDIFIYPGYKFKVVDALITNFHLPKSSLLMLVSAFAGHKNIMNAYQEAIKQKYRFYSYGDAMLII